MGRNPIVVEGVARVEVCGMGRYQIRKLWDGM